MNTIPQDQNTPKQILRLAAQRQIYSELKTFQNIYLVFSICIPIILSIINVFSESFKSYSIFFSISISILDITFITPHLKSRKKVAAKIQQLFDCSVLQIPWNSIKLSDKPNNEIIVEESNKYKEKDPNFLYLQNWYPQTINTVPIHIARLICQRINCWWDQELRKYYSRIINFILISFILIISISGIINNSSFIELLTTIYILHPVIVYIYRNNSDYKESSNFITKLQSYIDKNLEKSKITTNINEIEYDSFLIQDEIYEHRYRSPLIINFVYNRLKKNYETQSNKAVQELIEEFTHLP